MNKLVMYLCAVIFVLAGLSTPCYALPVTEFYQSGMGIYESVIIFGIGETGEITSIIDLTYPAEQKFTFDFTTRSFESQNDDIISFALLNVPPVSLRVREVGSILLGDPSHFTALVSATEFVNDPSSPFHGLGSGYTAAYEVMRDVLTGIGSLKTTAGGVLIAGVGNNVSFGGKGSYTSGPSPVS